MSNKNKKERDDEINPRNQNAEETDDSKATSKSSITPEGKYTPGYEVEENITGKATNRQEGPTKKQTEEEEQESKVRETLRTTAATTSTPMSANTPAQGKSSHQQKQMEREREEYVPYNEPRNEYRYGVQQQYYGSPRQNQRSPEDEFEEFVTSRARQRNPQAYAQQQPQEYRQQQRQGYNQQYQQQYDPRYQQGYSEPYPRQYSQRQPQASWEQRRQQYMPPQQYAPPRSYGRHMEEFEQEQPYGNYHGYGNRPYRQPGMMSNYTPYQQERQRYNEPERERQYEERYRRQNTAYRFGNDVNYGFGNMEDEYQNPFTRSEYAPEYGRGRANEQFGRGSGDWSNQGQGYNDYDREKYWDDDRDWGRRAETRRNAPEKHESSHRTSRHYFGDDYVPRYSSDWSRGFEDVYERGLNEDPWYNSRRDNDNRRTWQNTDRFENRNSRHNRHSEDDEESSHRYNDERTPRYDEDYQYSSSSGRNQPRQEQSRRQASPRNEHDERQHTRKQKGRRNH